VNEGWSKQRPLAEISERSIGISALDALTRMATYKDPSDNMTRQSSA